MNVNLAKALDHWVGRPITNLLMKPKQVVCPVSPHSFLIIRPGGIGDAVLLAPVISQLKRIYPDIHITILAERRNTGVFALIPAVDRLYCYDRPVEFLQAVRRTYDVVIDSEQSHHLSAVVARFVHAPVKIGFDTNERRRMFTYTVPYSHDDYETVSFARLLGPLIGSDNPVDTTAPFLTLLPANVSSVEKLVKPLGGKTFVTIFSGASIPERRWGADRFKEVADVLQQAGYGVVVVDQGDAQAIAGSFGINLAGQTTLAETSAIVAHSALLISGDSGVLHIAVGLDVPSISLFGPGRALKWAPKGFKHVVINKQLPCSPCTTFGTTPPCPYNAKCMREITVSEVLELAGRGL